MTIVEYDVNGAKEFLETFRPESDWLLSTKHPEVKGLRTHLYNDENRNEFVDDIEAAIEAGFSIYYHVNETPLSFTKRASKEDIVACPFLHIDVDPRDGKELVAERSRILSLLESPPADVPHPTVIIDSGGGFQALWKLESPLSVEEAEARNKWLADRLGGDRGATDASRILRLPGTVNYPNEKKQAKGRVAAPAKLIRFADYAVYSADDFGTEATRETADVEVEWGELPEVDVTDLADLLKEWVEFIMSPPEGDRSKQVAQVINHLNEEKFSIEKIAAVLLYPEFKISERHREKPDPEKFVKEEIERLLFKKPMASLIEKFEGHIDDEKGEESKNTEPRLDELNERFAVLTEGSNAGTVVDLQIANQPYLIGNDKFDNVFANRLVRVKAGDKDKYLPASKPWRTYKHRREITGIGFEPTGSPNQLANSAYNCWCGFAVDPAPGESHKLILNHIRDYVCHGDQELFEWFTAWLADLIQCPGDKPGVAVALRGEPGAGKSILFRYLRAIFGNHAASISEPSHLTGRFNRHMQGLVVLGVEEAFWAGNKQAESKLKDLITAPEIAIEQKGRDIMSMSNHVHIIVTSNSDWVVPAGVGDRRWGVFDVLPDRKNDQGYWKPIYGALHGDGPANLLHYLLNHKYDRSTLFRPPHTKAKLDQTVHSLPSVEGWWLEELNSIHGVPTDEKSDDIFGTESDKMMVYARYEKWCEKRRIRPDYVIQFWTKLRQIVGSDLPEKRLRTDDGRKRVVELPDRDHCQKALTEHLGADNWTELAA